MLVHLIDGTYELFRHFYGLRRFTKGEDPPFGAVIGVLNTVLELLETGATHVGVATDHVIESFRTISGRGTRPARDRARAAGPVPSAGGSPCRMGVVVWPMVELEADDALASAACLASEDESVEKVCIWTPDKDLAQCVRGDRVVQVVRRGSRFGMPRPSRRSTGRAGFPTSWHWSATRPMAILGFRGSARRAARLLNRYGTIEEFPAVVLGENRDLALLFKILATLRSDAQLFDEVDELRWRGPTDDFAGYAGESGGQGASALHEGSRLARATWHSNDSPEGFGHKVKHDHPCCHAGAE